MSAVASLDAFLEKVAQRDGNQPEFLQAVREVFTSIWPFLEANPKYRSEALLERLVEPERAFQFRVAHCQWAVRKAVQILILKGNQMQKSCVFAKR